VAGRIRDSDIAEVRDRVRVDEVIGEYVALRRAGAGSLKGLCPFHEEKTPSFNVRASHGTFHCFGCGEGGDAIAFLMKMDHISFVEAVERLAERVGYRLTYEGGGSSVQRDRGTRSRLLEANKKAAEFYAAQLKTPEAASAVQFLTTRGFDVAAAQHFGCGYAPAGWDLLTKHLLAAGFTLDELMKAGLSKEGRRGPIDRFHRRLLWSIKDLGGDVVGFGARRLFDDDGIEAKYLNTSDTPVYHKTKVLFGLDLAKREIAKRRQVVVVEGYTDVMAMHLAGVPTAVASCGTAFGSEHISVIRRLIGDDSFDLGEVIYTFDGDAAGQAAALKAFEGDQSFAAQTFVAIAPDGQDPCELRQSGGDTAVRDLVARREPLFEFAIRSMLRDHNLDTAEGRVAALQRGSRAGRAGTTSRWSSGGSGRRPGHPPRRAAVPATGAGSRWRHRPRTTRGCTCSGRRSKPRCRSRRLPGRATTSCPSRCSSTRRSPRCTAPCRLRAGCAAVATATHGWMRCLPSARRRPSRWSGSWRWSRSSCRSATPTRPATSAV
jgi:DNA primase